MTAIPQADESDPWAGFEPGPWIDGGTFTVDREWHERALDALEFPDEGRAVLGDRIHPGALALEVLSRLGSVLRERTESARPDRPRILSLHRRQRCRVEGPMRLGEPLRILGRIASKSLEGHPTMIREAWLLGEDGTPRLFYAQTSRLAEVRRLAE